MTRTLSPLRNAFTAAWGLCAITLLSGFAFGQSANVDSKLARIDQLLASDKIDQAVTEARQLNSAPSSRSVRSLARLAHTLGKRGQLDTATELFDLAIEHHQQVATTPSGDQHTLPLHLAAISTAVKNNDNARVLRSLQVVASQNTNMQPKQRSEVSRIAFSVAASFLTARETGKARTAYEIAETIGKPTDVPSAVLGQAWASVIDGSDPVASAKQLSQFVERFPDHADAAVATRACARCLAQSGRDDDANRVLADLIGRWPDSTSTLEVIGSHVQLEPDQIPDVVRRWITAKMRDINASDSTDLSSWSPEIMGMALRIANHERDIPTATTLTRWLAKTDVAGQTVADVLNRSNASDSESFATYLIAPTQDSEVTAGAREAAARWAGRNQKWNMIAMTAASESVNRLTEGRTAAVERLFAESLMQTGRTGEAAVWWNHLVDHRKSADFATLLRCAEAETATGTDTELASQRIAMARAATSDEPPLSITLVDLLEAELAIRRSRFDEARSLLENVVRGVEIDPGLRGRAQWLIGETHYLQHHFSEAIDAYRSVEGVDPAGPWVAASMIQAGKSFEQLGRTREAAVCYGNLLGRFADSPHADSARRRMAAIDPNLQPSSTESIRR